MGGRRPAGHRRGRHTRDGPVVVLALATGLAVFIGIALGLLGGGGSILTVPLLVYIVGMDTKQAIASGLFVVGVTSLVGMASHARAGRVRWRTGLVFGAAGMVGAFLGARIGAHLPGALLLIAFALMMVATAIAMIRGRRSDTAADRASLPLFRTITDGALVGLVTGTVGAGRRLPRRPGTRPSRRPAHADRDRHLTAGHRDEHAVRLPRVRDDDQHRLDHHAARHRRRCRRCAGRQPARRSHLP